MIVLVEFILCIKSCLVFQDDDSFRISVSMIYDATNVVEHVDQSTRQYYPRVPVLHCGLRVSFLRASFKTSYHSL